MAASSVLDELCTLLGASGLGLVEPTPSASGNLFAGFLPDLPDAAVALLETPGAGPDYDLGATTGIKIEHPRVQVLSRGVIDDYVTPRLMAQKVLTVLDGPVNQALSGVYYMNIDILQSPFLLNRDAKGRVLIAFNVSAWKAPSPTS